MSGLNEMGAAAFCATFANGYYSGIGLQDMLSLLEKQGLGKSMLHKLEVSLLDEGKTLSETFEQHKVLDPEARALIASAERIGELADLFSVLEQAYRDRFQLGKYLFGRAVEPLIAVGISLAIPELYRLVMSVPVTHITGGVIWDYLKPGFFKGFLLILLYLLFYLVWTSLPVGSPLKRGVRRLIGRVPILGQGFRELSVSNFCRFFAMGIRGGLQLFDALEVGVRASSSSAIMGSYSRVEKILHDGKQLHEALRKFRGLPSEVIDRVMVSERTGRIDEVLTRAADEYYELGVANVKRRMSGLMTVVRLLLIAVMVLIMGMALTSSNILAF